MQLQTDPALYGTAEINSKLDPLRPTTQLLRPFADPDILLAERDRLQHLGTIVRTPILPCVTS